jgi:hypothetical protein
MVKIAAGQVDADKIKEVITQREIFVSVPEIETEAIAADVKKELVAALSLLKEAIDQLKGLAQGAIPEVRHYADPYICIGTIM